MTDRHTTPVRRLAALVAGIMAGVGALTAPAALATSPQPTKLASSGSFTETDFCGTGAVVAIESSFHGTLFNAPNQEGLEFWLTDQAEDVFTNLATGQKATFRSAGTQRWWFVHDGDPATPPLSVHARHRHACAARDAANRRRADAGRRLRRAHVHLHDLRRRDRGRARAASAAARTARRRERHVLRDDDRGARALSLRSASAR